MKTKKQNNRGRGTGWYLCVNFGVFFNVIIIVVVVVVVGGGGGGVCMCV